MAAGFYLPMARLLTVRAFLSPTVYKKQKIQEDCFVVGRNPGKTHAVFYCEKGSELVFFFRLFLEM